MNKLYLILIVSILLYGWVDTDENNKQNKQDKQDKHDDKKPPTEPTDQAVPDVPLQASVSPSPKKAESYDKTIERLINEKFKPSVDEVVERTHSAGYYHVDDKIERDIVHDICGSDHETCEPKIMNFASHNFEQQFAPTDPKVDADKKIFQSKRDKEYGRAIKKGTSQAEKEIKQYGTEPFGGVMIPSLQKEAEKLETEGAKSRSADNKGAKTAKGSKAKKARSLPTGAKPRKAAAKKATKAKNAPKKGLKSNDDEPDVGTAPTD